MHQRTQTRRTPQAGFALVELAVAITVLAIMAALILPQITARRQDVREQVAAQQTREFSEASSQYIKENFDAVYAASTAGPYAVNAATVRTAGMLRSDFSTVNAYGQTHCLIVRHSPSATATLKLLESMSITEGGTAIRSERVPFVAAMIGASGGAFENVGGSLLIRGAYGGFQVNASSYNTATCTGTRGNAGNIASALFFDNRNLIADYLYRYDVPGHPEANQMFTNLTMNNNNVNDANQINATTFVDKNNPTYQVTPSGTSNLNSLTVNQLYASVYYDKDNPSFYVDPNGTSNIYDSFITNRSTTVRLSSLLPNYVDKGDVVLFADQYLAKPTCPDAGTPAVRVTPAVFQPDTSLLSNVYAVDAGSAWQVKMTSAGGVNMPPGTQVVASYGCRYL